MIMPSRQFLIRKVRPRSPWADSYPWRMSCRRCGRQGHHRSQRRALMHVEQHDCSLGSLW